MLFQEKLPVIVRSPQSDEKVMKRKLFSPGSPTHNNDDDGKLFSPGSPTHNNDDDGTLFSPGSPTHNNDDDG